MKALIVNTPHPACILRLTDPARAHTPAYATDVRKTFEAHWPELNILDDYDLVERSSHLDMMGEFQ